MSGRADSDTEGEMAASETTVAPDETDDRAEDSAPDETDDPAECGDGDLAECGEGDPDDLPEGEEDARRARWTAAGTGAALTLAGLAAALLRLTRSTPALVPAAYAGGAAVCAAAAVLGSRGRTRRALWLLIAGVMVMALGDQFD
ncbi:hypothetical protein [Streptomyces sp. NPDC007984]|uniref:hypothetical protein n=1 Tax=Streptomyces sp. NPDC007984 TaxID=3364801 RepID=UPI0036E942FE